MPKNIELSQIKCNFVKREGHTYHLYKNDQGYYFSMISPKNGKQNLNTLILMYMNLMDP